MRYRFVYAQQAAHRLTRLCQTLGVSRSGYDAWRRRPASARTRANAQLLERLQRLHRQTKARLGPLRCGTPCSQWVCPCGRHRVARLRRVHGLEVQRTRRFRVVVEQHQFAPPAPNRLHQVFVAPAVNRIWVGDLTAIATRRAGCIWRYCSICTRAA
jgi:putative transposase